ncbi:MAG: hypothetical protein IKS48_09825 [Eubacterium sp.]|nr:hypothetical protein [Eubacterium sp.]
MRSNEERIDLLHKREKELIRERDKIHLFVNGSLCTMLAALLVCITLNLTDRATGYASNQYTGASLLDVSVGGYVMVAVVAFMLGVVITIAIRKLKDKEKNKETEDKDKKE